MRFELNHNNNRIFSTQKLHYINPFDHTQLTDIKDCTIHEMLPAYVHQVFMW